MIFLGQIHEVVRLLLEVKTKTHPIGHGRSRQGLGRCANAAIGIAVSSVDLNFNAAYHRLASSNIVMEEAEKLFYGPSYIYSMASRDRDIDMLERMYQRRIMADVDM